MMLFIFVRDFGARSVWDILAIIGIQLVFWWLLSRWRNKRDRRNKK